MNGQGLGLYLHIPFCQRKCPYCDFNSYEGRAHLIPRYLEALMREVELWSAALAASGGGRVETVYIGGGTPSLLSAEQVAGLLDACRHHLAIADGAAVRRTHDAEVSLEANPGSVTGEWLEKVRRAGVNRLSLGVQSLGDADLRLLGRIHSAAEARVAFSLARQVGFDNISLDLIYGLPGQTMAAWQAGLERALSLGPEHLSLYALTIEEETPFGQALSRGEMAAPDTDLVADMYLLAEELLAKAGYDHYEISNWCRPGRQCQHNLGYWLRRPYLGVGAGAHSCLGGCRFANANDPDEYVARLRNTVALSLGPPFGGAVTWWEEIGPELAAAEAAILGLRLADGVDLNSLGSPPVLDAKERYGEVVRDLAELDLLTEEAGRLRLTSRGRLLGNEVFERFLPPP